MPCGTSALRERSVVRRSVTVHQEGGELTSWDEHVPYPVQPALAGARGSARTRDEISQDMATRTSFGEGKSTIKKNV